MKIVGWFLIVFGAIDIVLFAIAKNWSPLVFAIVILGLGIYLVDRSKKRTPKSKNTTVN